MSQASKKQPGFRGLVEVIGALGLIVSLLLLAYEVRQNTLAARAAAIQQIGIATAEMWGEIGRDPLMIRIIEKRSEMPSEAWRADDWARFLTQMLAWSRLAETGLLQVDEGLLPPSSLETLGYASTKSWLKVPEMQCIWKHRLRAWSASDSRPTWNPRSNRNPWSVRSIRTSPTSNPAGSHGNQRANETRQPGPRTRTHPARDG